MFAIASVAGPAAAAGNTLTVDPSTADNNEDSDNDNHYATIQAAVDAADAGDTIEVAAGTYDPVVIDKEVTVIGAGSGQSTIVGNSSFAMLVGADSVTVRGFTMVAQDDGSALIVEDQVDTSVRNLVVENNHFTSADGERALRMVKVNNGGPENPQQVAFRNNKFTGKAFVGMHLDADASTFADNTFDVDASDQIPGGIMVVEGESNTLENNIIGFSSDSFVGLLVLGTDHTVNGLTLDGHLDEHQHEPDRLDYGIIVGGSDHTLSNVHVMDSEVGINVGHAGASQLDPISATDVTLSNVVAEGNNQNDLNITDSADHVMVDGFQATSTDLATNVRVDGSNHTLKGVTSASDTQTGIWLGAEDTAIKSASIMNKDTGIAVDDASGSGVWNSEVTSNGEGIDIYGGTGYAIESNDISSNDVGIHVYSADVSVRDNTISNNGVGINVTDGQSVQNNANVSVHWNDIVGNDAGIQNTGVNDVQAQMNWFGSEVGPSGAAKLSDMSNLAHGDSVSEGVVYDPFLTAPKDKVPHSWEKVEKFGHDLKLEGGEGYQTVAFPGAGEKTVAETLKDLSNRQGVMVWGYDADHPQGPWLSGGELANMSVSSLDAFIVTGLDKDAEVALDHLDSQSPPNGPGEHDVDAGWNFVGASQYGNVEDVFQSTSNLQRVVHVYQQPESQPYGWSGDASTYAHTWGASSPHDASAYTGYWVYAEGDGQLSAVMPGGTTACDEIELLSNQPCS